MLLIILSALLAGILGLVGVLLAWSYPGKPEPFVDTNGNPLPGSISEKTYDVLGYLSQIVPKLVPTPIEHADG